MTTTSARCWSAKRLGYHARATRDAALTVIAPALRRSTIKRTSVALASTVLLVGGTVAAVNVSGSSDDAISVDTPATVTSGVAPTTNGPVSAPIPTGDDDPADDHPA